MSLRNTGRRMHTPKISLSKSDISPERLYPFPRSRFLEKLMVNIGVSWNRKTNIFFINPQKTKVDQNCYIDLLNTSLLRACRRHYPGNDFELLQDSAPSHRAEVMQQFLWQNTLDFIAADEWASYSPDLNPFRWLHLGYRTCMIWCTKADGFRLQVHRTWKKQSITNGRISPLRQFENSVHDGKSTECS